MWAIAPVTFAGDEVLATHRLLNHVVVDHIEGRIYRLRRRFLLTLRCHLMNQRSTGTGICLFTN